MKPFDLLERQWWKAPQGNFSTIASVFAAPLPTGDPITITSAWGSMAVDLVRGDLIIHGGGHLDYAGNEGYAFSYNPYSRFFMQWRRKWYPSPSRTGNESYADGTPTSAHTYSSWLYYQPTDQLLRMPGVAIYDAGDFTSRTYRLDAQVESPGTTVPTYWRQLATSATGGTADAISAVDPVSGNVFTMWGGGSSLQGLRMFNPRTNAWTTLTTFDDAALLPHSMNACVIPGEPSYLAFMGGGAGNLQIKSCVDPWAYIGGGGGGFGATGDTGIQVPTGPGFVFDGVRPVGYSGLLASGTDQRDLYYLDIGAATWTRKAGFGDIPPDPPVNGAWGRFNTIGNGLCAWVASTGDEVYWVRTSPAPTNSNYAFMLGNTRMFIDATGGFVNASGRGPLMSLEPGMNPVLPIYGRTRMVGRAAASAAASGAGIVGNSIIAHSLIPNSAIGGAS